MPPTSNKARLIPARRCHKSRGERWGKERSSFGKKEITFSLKEHQKDDNVLGESIAPRGWSQQSCTVWSWGWCTAPSLPDTTFQQRCFVIKVSLIVMATVSTLSARSSIHSTQLRRRGRLAQPLELAAEDTVSCVKDWSGGVNCIRGI